MTKIIIVATAFLISLFGFSQVSENRSVGDFSKLKASHGVEVVYTVSDQKSIKVETDNTEKLKFVKTEVEAGTLKIYVDKGDGDRNGSKKGKKRIDGIHFNILKVTVSGPALEAIKTSSSADVKIQNLNSASQITFDLSSSSSVSGKFRCDKMTVEASSSAGLKAEIETQNTIVETSSSSDVKLSGKTVKLTVKSSSSSTCDADKLITDDVTATASSSANINLQVEKSIVAKASTSADISYRGNPSDVVTDTNTSGSVRKR